MKPAFAIVTLLVAGDRGPATLPADPRGDGPPRLGLGASGLVFGFATYLVARGASSRRALPAS